MKMKVLDYFWIYSSDSHCILASLFYLSQGLAFGLISIVNESENIIRLTFVFRDRSQVPVALYRIAIGAFFFDAILS